MKKSTVFRLGTAFLATALFVFTACQDKDYFVPTTPDAESNDTPSLLNYSTSQDVVLNVSYEVPEGFISVFEVYTQNPLVLNNGRYELKSDITPIAGGICVSGEIRINKTVPATAKELYVYSPDLFAPKLMSAKIEAGTANFEIVDLTITSDQAGTRTIGNEKIDGYLRKGSDGNATTVGNAMDISAPFFRPNYVLSTKDIDAKYLNRIKNTFPNEKAVANEDYFHDAILYLYKEAEVKLCMVGGDAMYMNTLSYFFFKGTPDEIGSVDKNTVQEIVAIPLAKIATGGIAYQGVNVGDMVQLMYCDETGKWVKEFPQGVTIGFILRSNGFQPNYSNGNPYIDTSKDKFYSCAAWNTHDSTFPQHTIYFNAATENESKAFVCFGFEDSKGGGDKDCNDVLFHVDIDPFDAIEKPPHVPEVGEVIHTESKKGTLGFEDYWPWKGDYDLNDVVVTYESKTTYVIKTKDGEPASDITLRSIEDNITLVHSGADYTNAFAYKMDMSSSLVKSATIDGNSYTPVADGNGFIVKITDDVATEVQCVKPSKDVYNCTPKTFKVKLTFDEENGITQKAFNENSLGAPYNPFISPKAGVEVHLPFYPPTKNANMDLFGNTDDRSDPAANRWYVGAENNPYPFAIHLFNVGGFKKIPVETKEISYTYPKFSNWVSSNFTQDQDWYEYPADVE